MRIQVYYLIYNKLRTLPYQSIILRECQARYFDSGKVRNLIPITMLAFSVSKQMLIFTENWQPFMRTHKIDKAFIPIIVLCLLACVSCHQQINQTLVRLQPTIGDNADSVALVLDSMMPGYQHMSEGDKALFDLCRWQIAIVNADSFPLVDEIDRCISYFEKHKHRYPMYAAESYYTKALYYKEKPIYDKANECLLKSLDLAEKTNSELLCARIYLNLGHIAYMQGKYEIGLWYMTKSAELYQKNNYTTGQVNVYQIMSSADLAQSDWEQSRVHAGRVLELTTDSIKMGDMLDNIGVSYYYEDRFDSAYHYMIQGLQYPAYSTNRSMRYYNLANLFSYIEKYDSAQYYAFKALELPMNIYIAEEIYRILAKMAIEKGDKQMANEYSRIRDCYTDSILVVNQQADITYIDQIHQGAVTNEKHKSRQNFFIAGLVIMLVAIGFLFAILRKRERAKAEISKSLERYKEDLKNISAKSTAERTRTIMAFKTELENYIAPLLKAYNGPLSGREQVKKEAYIEYLHIDNEKLFIATMNRLLVSFPDKLKHIYPSITYREILYCTLFVLDVPTPDIALIFDYTQSSQYKFKQRLIKKWQFTTTKEFDASLLDLLYTDE